MVDFSKLYWFGEAGERGALHVKPVMEIDKNHLLFGTNLPPYPVVFEHHLGGKPRDVIGTGYASLYLISDRIRAVLESGGFTGWTTFPVQVFGKGRSIVEGYSGFAVVGRCGPLDDTKRRIEWREPPVPNGRPYRVKVGAYFDPASWDGSDIFIPEGTRLIVMTERVKAALEQAKITNVEFGRLTEFEVRFY